MLPASTGGPVPCHPHAHQTRSQCVYVMLSGVESPSNPGSELELVGRFQTIEAWQARRSGPEIPLPAADKTARSSPRDRC